MGKRLGHQPMDRSKIGLATETIPLNDTQILYQCTQTINVVVHKGNNEVTSSSFAHFEITGLASTKE